GRGLACDRASRRRRRSGRAGRRSLADSSARSHARIDGAQLSQEVSIYRRPHVVVGDGGPALHLALGLVVLVRRTEALDAKITRAIRSASVRMGLAGPWPPFSHN